MEYDKAGATEKTRIRRATELVKLSPKDLARAYEYNPFDKNVILDYWSSFSEEGKKAVEDIQARLSNISLKSDFEIQMEAFDRLQALYSTRGKTNAPKEAGVYTPPIAPGTQVLNNNYTIPITLEGAITDADIQALLQKIEEKIKEQPNYIGSKDLVGEIEKDNVKKERLTNLLRPGM
jgi:hypothetical protein